MNASAIDAIFGVTNHGGELPISIPRHVGQVPIHHGQKTGELVMEPGPAALCVGRSSSDIRSSAMRSVSGQPRIVNREERAFLSA